MATHLVSFVRTGAPAENWPAYEVGASLSMRFDTAAPAAGGGLNLTLERGAHAKQCAFWDAHPVFDQESVVVNGDFRRGARRCPRLARFVVERNHSLQAAAASGRLTLATAKATLQAQPTPAAWLERYRRDPTVGPRPSLLRALAALCCTEPECPQR